jgi:hypothetical protein
MSERKVGVENESDNERRESERNVERVKKRERNVERERERRE